MKGLLMKDLLNLRGQAKILLPFIVLYLFLGAFTENSSFFSGFVIILTMMMPITAYSFDEKAKWDRYAMTMPISRKTMVLERYLLGIVMGFGGIALGLLGFFFRRDGGFGDVAIGSLSLGSFGFLYLAVMFPILFKLGTEKARVLMILVMMVPFAGVAFLGAAVSGLGDSFIANIESWLLLFTVLTALLFIGSIFLSIKIYSKKEF